MIAQNGHNGRTIMVIEDDKDISDALGKILESQGYSVRFVSEVTEDFDKEFYSAMPDLVLLDIWVGGGDGRDLAKRLRSHSKTKRIPIILVSANISTPQIAEELEVEDFIIKPFDVDHLLGLVEKHLAATP